MTTRERAIARLEMRREWAAGRRDKAEACFAVGAPYRGDIAFNTQPGHIPERARVIRATDRGVEHLNMADRHESKAAGIATQLDRSIFSDDPDAIEAIQAKVAAGREQLARMKASNAAWRKGGVAGLVALGWTQEKAEAVARRIETAYSWEKQPCAGWQLTNLGANLRRLEKRIEEIKTRQARTAEAAETPGGVKIDGDGDWVRVTFAEKPERDVLNELREAGFRWGGGSWCGPRAKLPASVNAEN